MIHLLAPRLALAVLALVLCSACRSNRPDYGRALDDGASALIPLGKGEKVPDLRGDWDAREELRPALENSLYWTRRNVAQRHFPIAGIDHERALRSLERFAALLDECEDAEAFQRAIESEFQVYKSAGWDSRGGGVLFTGYCTPILRGSLEQGGEYVHPLYALPPDLVKGKDGEILGRETPGGMLPYPSRRAIDGFGLLANKDLELAWLADPLDAYIAHVNGSAFIELPSGEMLRLGYAGKNGRTYTSLGKELIEAGFVKKEEMGLPAIRAWGASAEPEVLREFLERNESYVFFQPISGNPHGSLDVEVTARRSLATDKTLFPRGALVFVDCKLPGESGETAFGQLLFDQDTGGAIRTAGRADIYLGIGPEAEALAGRTQSDGQLYYFFLRDSAAAEPAP